MRLQGRGFASDPSSAGHGMKVELDKQRAMHWRFVLKDDPKVPHSSKKGWAGKHEVTPGGLQAGGGNACRLKVGLSKSVSNCAKIREAKFPE